MTAVAAHQPARHQRAAVRSARGTPCCGRSSASGRWRASRGWLAGDPRSRPGMNNLMLTFARPLPTSGRCRPGCWPPGSDAEPLPLQGRLIELPVVYGGDGGPHLADVIAHTGLGVDELVERPYRAALPRLRDRQPSRLLLPRRHGRAHRDPAPQGPRRSASPVAPSRSAASKPAFPPRPGPSGWNTIGTHLGLLFRSGALARPRCWRPATRSASAPRR